MEPFVTLKQFYQQQVAAQKIGTRVIPAGRKTLYDLAKLGPKRGGIRSYQRGGRTYVVPSEVYEDFKRLPSR